MASKIKPRKARVVTKEELDYLLSLDNKDCLKTSVFMECFGTFNGKKKFNTYDVMNIPPKSYHNNKNTFVTTVGSWFFNKGCIDYPGLFDVLGYVNDPVTKKLYGDLQDKLSYAIMEDRIEVPQFKQWIMCLQKFMNYSTIICTTSSEDMLLISKTIEPKKKELLKKYEKELAAGDAYTINKIENELLQYCEETLKDDPAWDNIKAGAGADLGNNFKNMYVIKGAQKDPDPTKGYNIITSCYSEGVSKEDYPAMANSLAAGPYARARKTSIWGYEEKKFLLAFQHVKLGPKGSDCKTTRTITVTLDKNMMKLLMYSYIVEGSKLVRLDSTTMSKYAGKTVKMRFSSLCKNECICNKCAGDLYYILGVENIGTATPQMASAVKNIMMKAFHDSTEKFTQMNAMEAFGE
jgi:hypothetical protein